MNCTPAGLQPAATRDRPCAAASPWPSTPKASLVLCAYSLAMCDRPGNVEECRHFGGILQFNGALNREREKEESGIQSLRQERPMNVRLRRSAFLFFPILSRITAALTTWRGIAPLICLWRGFAPRSPRQPIPKLTQRSEKFLTRGWVDLARG